MSAGTKLEKLRQANVKTYDYYALDGILMTHDGKRSIFDDVDE